jgi:polar amino acid transport system substrate-binding protein
MQRGGRSASPPHDSNGFLATRRCILQHEENEEMGRRRAAVVMVMTVLSAACAGHDDPMTAVQRELAPDGRLRAGVTVGNPVLAMRDAAGGDPSGVAVDVAREIGRRLNVDVAFATYDGAAAMADAAATGAWAIAFLAADPDRAGIITFTPPYLELDATYLVPAGSRIQSVEEVDVAGARIAARPRSAYDLYLRRSLRHARLVYPEGSARDVDLLVAGEADVLAGLRDVLIADASRPALAGARVLDGHFALMQQAIGVPKGHDAAAAWLRTLVDELKRDGFVAGAIAATGARGARVAPAGS